MTVRPGLVFAGFPNPIGWTVDKVAGFVGGAATAGFEAVIGGLVAWVVDAVVWVVGGVFDFFLDAADPNVQADWFVAGDGPYRTTAAIGASLMVAFVLAGITQGALAGDVGGMIRRMVLDLPMSVLGIVGLVTFTQVLIRLTDYLSTWVLSSFEDDITDFIAVVVSLSRLGGGGATAFVIFLLGLLTVLAGVALVGELAVRAALVYIVVALAPLVFAAQLWPALKGTTQKLLQLLAALILSKLVMAIALAVAAAAAVGTGSGGEVTALPEPEVVAEEPGGSVTQAVGILLAAAAAFGVAAFSPLMVARLLPLAEAASVAQGVKGGPVRATQSATSMAYSAQMLRDRRMRVVAGGSSGSSPPDVRPAGRGRRGGGPGTGGGGEAGGPRGGRPSPGGSGGAGSGAGGGAAGGASSSAAASGSGAVAAAGPAGVVAAAGAGTVKRAAAVPKRAVQRSGETAERMAGGTADGSGGPGARVGARRVPNSEQRVPPHPGTVPARRRRPPGSPGSPGSTGTTSSGGGDGR